MAETLEFEKLSDSERRSVVDQALVLFEDLYVHLPLKQSMHAVRPIQRLKVLRSNIKGIESDFDFHNEMTEIFNSVRDLHTNYVLPAPFPNRISYLPFQVEACWKDGARSYIVSRWIAGFRDDKFTPGVKILNWGGVPIERAVEIAGQKHAGSNPPARHARGIRGLTIRPLGGSLPPDAKWVDVQYETGDGTVQEKRFEWDLFVIPQEEDDPEATDGSLGKGAAMGIDIDEDLVRRASKTLFVPDMLKMEEERLAENFPYPRRPPAFSSSGGLNWPNLDWPNLGWPDLSDPDLDWATSDQIPTCGGGRLERGSAQGAVDSFMPKAFSAKAVVTTSGSFGYIRIRTFNVNNAWKFVLEFVRLAAALPQSGLIIDVRDNGGGLILAGELLLQTLTPSQIEPERLQFINTPATRDLIERHSGDSRPHDDFDLTPWLKSARLAISTGGTFTRGFPLTTPDAANLLGQQYRGPVVLITNARCYSTTDIFAAGFKDHHIGLIIGADANTGAGGANVWRHGLLKALFDGIPDNPIKDLPKGMDMRVAIRRTVRVGPEAGTPLEDLGVVPDIEHQMTRNDIFEGNLDLIERAGVELARQESYTLDAVGQIADGDNIELELTTLNLDRIDAYIDDRPVATVDVENDTASVRIPEPAEKSIVDLKGFAAGNLRAARRMFF
jgi:hypothetical protein